MRQHLINGFLGACLGLVLHEMGFGFLTLEFWTVLVLSLGITLNCSIK
jgi:hypothetical protein